MSRQDKQIRSIRFDAERLQAVVKEDLTSEFLRLAAIEIANKLIHELVLLNQDKDT